MKTYEDLSGQKFGILKAIIFYRRHKSRKSIWLCICECGSITVVFACDLKRGHTRSCGCLAKSNSKTHGMMYYPEYNAWEGLKNRCDNPSGQDFKDYGGRGITYQDTWKKFENFYADMGPKEVGTSIDRIDNNGNYTKENCRWATPKQQANNKRNNRFITWKGETKTLQQWADHIGINQSVLCRRLKYWTIERALTEPINNTRRKK